MHSMMAIRLDVQGLLANILDSFDKVAKRRKLLIEHGYKDRCNVGIIDLLKVRHQDSAQPEIG